MVRLDVKLNQTPEDEYKKWREIERKRERIKERKKDSERRESELKRK